jgi:DNA-binding NarL/FixJ family response regulator
MRPIRVVVADDHRIVREGLVRILTGGGCEVVAEAADGFEAVERAVAAQPDVVVLDLSMPRLSGLEALRRIRQEAPRARVLVLTVHDEIEYVMPAVAAGAAGYLLKSMLRRDLVDTIRNVNAGKRHIPVEVALELAGHVTDNALSARETEVLRLVALGSSNKRIGLTLHITEDTVKAHMKAILYKLGASDRTHAVTLALRRGIIDLHG